MEPRCVLLVEDDPDDAFLFKRSLDVVSKCAVYLVADVRSALSFMEGTCGDPDTKPDVIFVDLRLRSDNGAELISRLCADTRFRGIPRCVVSGAENAQLLALPVERTLEKPVSATSLAIALAGL